MRVELRIEAISDLVDAAQFYDQQCGGLGDRFADAMFVHLTHLETIAGGHEVVFGLHRMLAKRFPYAVYYKVVGDLVDIVAILDCRRNPNKISKMLADRTEKGDESE